MYIESWNPRSFTCLDYWIYGQSTGARGRSLAVQPWSKVLSFCQDFSHWLDCTFVAMKYSTRSTLQYSECSSIFFCRLINFSQWIMDARHDGMTLSSFSYLLNLTTCVNLLRTSLAVKVLRLPCEWLSDSNRHGQTGVSEVWSVQQTANWTLGT